MPDGRQQIVGLQFAPDLVGWPVGPQNFINAKSATDIKICSVSKYCMDRLISKNPAIMSKILERTLGDLDEARDWMLTLGRKNAEEKVASFLLLIAKRTQPSHARKHLKIGLPISRTEIADFLGLTIETVSRKLATLQSQGVLKLLARHHVVVPCLVSLMERAGAAESKISHRASQH